MRFIAMDRGEPSALTTADRARTRRTTCSALVSISDPPRASLVEGLLRRAGPGQLFEGTVPWEIRDGDGVVRRASPPPSGSGDRLYPWETEIDLSDLAPGIYTFVAMTDDPSGGTEGSGPFTDTRTIIVR